MLHRVIRVAGIIFVAYLAISVLILLPALNFLAPWYVEKTFGRKLHTDIILYNPFALSVEVRGASLPEVDGSPFAGLDRAAVNLSTGSLWQPGWVFDAIEVEEFYVHIEHLAPGEFNFSDMLEALPESEPEPDDAQGLPGITIHHLSLEARRLSLTDSARETPFHTYYNDLAITVNELSTIIEGDKPYQVSAEAESGGLLHWKGTVSIPQARSEGQLSLDGLSLAPFWRFAEPWLNLELEQGELHLASNYQFDWKNAFSYSIGEGELSINDIAISPKDQAALPETSLTLKSTVVSGIALDSRTQHVEVAELLIDQPGIAGWMEGERISLQELFAVSGLPEEEEEADTTAEPGALWTAALAALKLDDGHVNWRSGFTDPPLLEVSPIEARLENLRWPFEGESPMGLAFRVNGTASLDIDGALTLGSGQGQLKYKLEGLPLTWINPNLPAGLNGEITGGEAGVEGQLSLAEFLPSSVALSGAIDNFAGQLHGTEDSVTSWETVRLTDLLVNLDDRSVSLAQLIINDYAGRLHIAKDGSVNASKVWKEEVGNTAEDLAEELELNQPWRVSVPEIYVTGSAIDFMDESLPIPFRTVIGDLHGEILNISSEPGIETKVNMKGSVDGYAPVVLQGTARPMGQPPALDLSLTFNGVDLSLLTPYSGTYAGYAIERGLLNLELVYSLEDNHLKGDNAVLIDQLKLGEHVDSEKAVDLPLEMALALLTDANGVINLQVPVSGDVNDPEFGLGSVIAGAFMNLITKAVTAPFALLANLAGTEEDLQRMNFASGSAELVDANKARLDQLLGALDQRPKLTLIILGRLNLEVDREYLQRVELNKELLASGLTQQQISSTGEAFFKAIEARYRELGIAGELPSPPSQYTAIVQTMNVTDAQMLELAQARAVAIKQYLVTEKGMSADRAAIEQTALDDEAHLFSGVELDLDM